MLQKLFTLLILVCLVGTVNMSYSQGNRKVTHVIQNGDAIRGDNGPIQKWPPCPMDYSPVKPPVTDNVNNVVITYSELDPNLRSTYGLQSNGVNHYIVQDPAHPTDIHAVFMFSTIPATWDDRNTGYSYSADGGVTWTYNGTIGLTRSGFPCLSMTPNGRALVSMHNTDGGGIQRGQLYVDAGEGVGSFNRLDPGLSQPALGNIWMVCAGTDTKAFVTGSQNGVDSTETNVTTSYTSPGTWLGWHVDHVGSDPTATAQGYAQAIGADGRWGLAFLTVGGDCWFTESTNQGVSWGTPAHCWTFRNSDSTGCFRSVDVTYEGTDGNHARVIFGLGWYNGASGYIPQLPSWTVVWGSDLNGGVPVTIDSAAGVTGTGTADVFYSCCRGVIGKTSGPGPGALYVVYTKARTDTSAQGNNFFDIYMRYSGDHGATWGPKTQLTNLPNQETQLVDCRWSSVSPTNLAVSSVLHNVYISCSRDTVAGSTVNGAPASIMRDMFIHVTITDPIGIRNISGTVPKQFSLSQNYPNPFNPTTKIRFDLPSNGNVTLKIFDVLGRELQTLVNGNLTAGIKEVDFDATNFPSGVYFYSIKAGNFTETKKMMLVK